MDTGLELLTPPVPVVASGVQLVPGLRPLAQDQRFSDPVILLAKAVVRNPLIDLRGGSSTARTSLSIELTEYLEYLLGQDEKSLEDSILLMSLHRDLLDLECSTRYSVFYRDIILHWTQESLIMIDRVDTVNNDLVEMFIWTILNHGGTMLYQLPNVASDDPGDPRFRLMLVAMNKYWQMQDWTNLQNLLLKFNPADEYMHVWYLTWQMVKKEYDQSDATSNLLLRNTTRPT